MPREDIKSADWLWQALSLEVINMLIIICGCIAQIFWSDNLLLSTNWLVLPVAGETTAWCPKEEKADTYCSWWARVKDEQDREYRLRGYPRYFVKQSLDVLKAIICDIDDCTVSFPGRQIFTLWVSRVTANWRFRLLASLSNQPKATVF